MIVAENVQIVQQRIEAACQRSGRDPQTVTLIAVSKKMPVDLIMQAYEAGLEHFGENRVEEAQTKQAHLAAMPIYWHMIGHVQSRKARDVVNLQCTLVHSLDDLKLAERYNRFALEQNLILPVLLEINVSGETSKSGWSVSEWETDPQKRTQLWQDVEVMQRLPGLRLEGLMTMAPIVDDPEAARPVFRSLANLKAALCSDFFDLPLAHLSMGMTDDFEVAIEEGATLVRIGRAIFGERP